MSDEFSRGLPKRNDPLPNERESFEDEPDRPARSVLASTPEDRLTAVLAHWGGFLSWILAPLILFLIQKDRRSLAAWHAREAFNFQLSLLIYYLLPMPFVCLLFIDLELFPLAIGLPIVGELVVVVFELVVIIWASVAGYRGEFFRCPLNIPFIPRPDLLIYSDDHADLD
jgi:uncharacterized Tic20 family protein